MSYGKPVSRCRRQPREKSGSAGVGWPARSSLLCSAPTWHPRLPPSPPPSPPSDLSPSESVLRSQSGTVASPFLLSAPFPSFTFLLWTILLKQNVCFTFWSLAMIGRSGKTETPSLLHHVGWSPCSIPSPENSTWQTVRFPRQVWKEWSLAPTSPSHPCLVLLWVTVPHFSRREQAGPWVVEVDSKGDPLGVALKDREGWVLNRRCWWEDIPGMLGVLPRGAWTEGRERSAMVSLSWQEPRIPWERCRTSVTLHGSGISRLQKSMKTGVSPTGH